MTLSERSSGVVEWIGIRPGRSQPMTACSEVWALRNRGLEKDYAAKRTGGKRQVTLIQQEDFSRIEAQLKGWAQPEQLRRNLVISGIDLNTLIGQSFRIGDAVFEGSGTCPPCRKMDAALGEGGCVAMTDLGGITARVLSDGAIRIGDAVSLDGVPDALSVAAVEQV